jgi:UDP-N-acetylglucosamine 2-epimerase (non-hydrolysing)
MKVLVVLGTRPEAIKLAPVLLALRATVGVQATLCVTGQHRQMLDPMLQTFGLAANVDLGIMKPNQSLFEITHAALLGVGEALRRARPDWLLVQGDTTTAMTAALAGMLEKVPVGHVEAGLRTFDKTSPWPEEINRRLIAPIADLHFAPTETAASHLLREGIPPRDVLVTGNTVVDALRLVRSRPGGDEQLQNILAEQAPTLLRSKRRWVLVTLHRRESHGRTLEDLCGVLRSVAQRQDVEIVYPVHLNPAVVNTAQRWLSDVPGVHLIKPLDYLPFLALLQRCHFVLTDSGGLQEEGACLNKPVIIAREKTERTEGVQAGTAVLGGVQPQTLLALCTRMLDDPAWYAAMAQAPNPYGDGRASERIVQALLTRAAAAAPGGA